MSNSIKSVLRYVRLGLCFACGFSLVMSSHYIFQGIPNFVYVWNTI